MAETHVLARGKYLELVRYGRWEFARRTGSTGVVMVVPRTSAGEVLLIEQHRPPVGGRVVEFPAGLAGDEPGLEDETLRTAAHRELLEETGYEAQRMHRVATLATSAGMTDESVTVFVAWDCVQRHAGGGVENEQIDVHRVPLADVDRWLAERVNAGHLIDARVYSGLYFLTTFPDTPQPGAEG